MTALWIIIAVIVVLAALLWILGDVMFRKFFLRDKNPEKTEATFFSVIEKGPNAGAAERLRRELKWLSGLPAEDIWCRSEDGLRLHGRLYLNPEKSTGDTIMLVHGYKSSAGHDFSCGCRFYFSQGLNILLIDQRAHGQSEGRYICFGDRERRDVIVWANWLINRFGPESRYILGGMSMGCTTVLLAGGEADFPPEIRGIIADCGFTSAGDEFRHVLRDGRRLPSFPILNVVGAICRRRAGFGFEDATTVEAVQRISIPVFFIHGTADKFVLPEFTKRNYEACASEKKRLLLVPGADHGMSYLVDEPGYTSALAEFIASL